MPKLERLAVLAGTLTGAALRAFPGLGGAALVSAGLWQAWPPLGFIAAGVALLLVDRRMP